VNGVVSGARLSVAIASVNGLPIIDECLQALDRQCGGVDVETIVVDCCRNGTAEHIRRAVPHVKLFEVGSRLGIPELRAIAVSHATADVVAIIEDHCIVPEDWAQETLRAHESGYVAVGGAVENGSAERITDWAAFFCEYSHAMSPITDGEADSIAGNNASYRRELLCRVEQSVINNCWEYFIHEELKKLGARFLSSPRVRLYHKKQFGFWYFLSQRFHYSRSFAAMRVARGPITLRLIYLLLSPLLPVLMMYRIGSQVLSKKRHYAEFVLSIPALTAFLLAYALGEFTGYLLGSGNSLYRVE
jgi:GT2 family glycosyltransferase